MCMPSAPEAKTQSTPPPAETPKPLASPEDGGRPLNLSQLRIASKNGLKVDDKPASGLTLPAA